MTSQEPKPDLWNSAKCNTNFASGSASPTVDSNRQIPQTDVNPWELSKDIRKSRRYKKYQNGKKYQLSLKSTNLIIKYQNSHACFSSEVN